MLPISRCKVLTGSSSVSHLGTYNLTIIMSSAVRQLQLDCLVTLLTAQITWHCVLRFHLPHIIKQLNVLESSSLLSSPCVKDCRHYFGGAGTHTNFCLCGWYSYSDETVLNLNAISSILPVQHRKLECSI